MNILFSAKVTAAQHIPQEISIVSVEFSLLSLTVTKQARF